MRSRFFLKLLRMVVLLLVFAAAACVYYAYRPIAQSAPVVDLEIARGDTMTVISAKLNAAGVQVWPPFLSVLARVTRHANKIKAGNYQVKQGMNSLELLELFSSGLNAYTQVALIEGWSFQKMRASLDAKPDIKHDTAGLNEQEIVERLKLDVSYLEGQFFPDTYFFARGTSDLEVLRRAHEQMQKVLMQEWAARAPNLPLASPQEALILASIIEKETGNADDRENIASVFINRLRIDMPLQTDPTVIYGMGALYDEQMGKIDTRTDTSFNTYTRKGLPPTPIAMPGRASIRAALNPATTSYFYFVAKRDGNGHSYFSKTFEEHNQAIQRYLKNRR